jgi:two-component system LytT family sensor kinase
MNFSRIRKLWLPAGIVILSTYFLLAVFFHNYLGFPSSFAYNFPAVFVITLLLFSWTSLMVLSVYVPSRFKQAYAVFLSAVLAWIHYKLFFYLIISIFKPVGLVELGLTNLAPVVWLVSFLIVGMLTVGFTLLGETKEESKDKARQDEINEMLREAELHKLQQQFQPHFLFNSLNSISALIASRPEEARTMVMKLSDFLRTTLKRGDEQGVTFQNEIDYLQLYLDIEKVRFGHRLEVKVTTTNDVLQAKIPTLLLQPIVENAIKFGLYGTTEKVIITLDARVENSMVIIKTTNPFDNEMLPQSGTGFGLNAIKRRLWLLFARNDLLETSTQQNTFITTLKTPLAS